MEIQKVGIVGCGTMGSGIAQVCAQSGYTVIAADVSETLLNKGLKSINFNLTRSVEKGKLKPEDKDGILRRIQGTTQLADLKDCHLIIEAAIENIELKKKIFSTLDTVLRRPFWPPIPPVYPLQISL
jgi:3-hydroxybutyryl-CoA dehydrogenase